MTAALAEPHEAVIKPSQVRVGVYVRLPLSWMEHSFLTSAFLVTSEEQVRDIAALGVDVYFDPRKSKVPPAPLLAGAPAPVEPAERKQRQTARDVQLAAKRERMAAMAAMRSRLDAAQKSFAAAAEQTATAFRQLGARPKESIGAVRRVSDEAARSLLRDPDATILMVTDKGSFHGDVAHAMSVMSLAMLLARHAGEGEAALQVVGTGALLHDVGMGGLNPSLLRNPARNRFEEASYQTHCALGTRELRVIGPVLSAEVLLIVLQHHEREDGRGYPAGLRGVEIARATKIVAIADRFDELTNPPDPALALSPFEALALMWGRDRSAFDETLLQHFVRAMGVYPPGTLVQLSDGRVGVVVAAAPETSRLCPQVLIYDPGTPRREAVIVDLAAAATGDAAAIRVDKALRMRERSPDELDYLLPRRKIGWFRSSG